MLLQTPEQYIKRLHWLASIGIKSPSKVKQAQPLHGLSLDALQRNFYALEEHGLTASEAKRVVQKFPKILTRSSERMAEIFDVLIRLYRNTARLADILLLHTHPRLFHQSPAQVADRLSYFIANFDATLVQTKKAMKKGVFMLPPDVMNSRLEALHISLGISNSDVRSIFGRSPELLPLATSTIMQNLAKLQQVGFSESEIQHMALTKPAILGLDMTSTNQSQKWQFLTNVMHFCRSTLAVRPVLFMSSLPNRLGPRWEYLLLARELGATDFSCAQEVVERLVMYTDAKFAAMYSHSALFSLPPYNKAFRQQWQQRWHFLVDDCTIAVADIGRHPAVLQTSLKEVLGPRWAFLVRVAGFHSPIDHLTALATLSDEEFSDVYGVANKCLYNREFIQLWQ